MGSTRQARIQWLTHEEGGRIVPLTAPCRYSTIGSFQDSPLQLDGSGESWSVVVDVKEPADPDGIMVAEVSMLVDAAPDRLLQPGSWFELYEGRQCVARGEVLG